MISEKKEVEAPEEVLLAYVARLRPPCPLCRLDAGVFIYKRMVKVKCDCCRLTMSWPLMVVRGKPMYFFALGALRERWSRLSERQPDPELAELYDERI